LKIISEFFEKHQMGGFEEGSHEKEVADGFIAAMSGLGVKLENFKWEVMKSLIMNKSIK
jgi:hypothetical protein